MLTGCNFSHASGVRRERFVAPEWAVQAGSSKPEFASDSASHESHSSIAAQLLI